MKAGRLNTPITIQSRDAGEDEAGGPLLTWTDFVSVWAHIRTENGMATIRNGVAADVRQHSIRIRYRTDITAGMRVVADGQNFDVLHVLNDMAGKEWTDLVCDLGGNDG